jgi:hypothetical protein
MCGSIRGAEHGIVAYGGFDGVRTDSSALTD